MKTKHDYFSTHFSVLKTSICDVYGLNLSTSIYHLVLRGTFHSQNACPYLGSNNVSMMSQTSDVICTKHIPLLPSSRARTGYAMEKSGITTQ